MKIHRSRSFGMRYRTLNFLWVLVLGACSDGGGGSTVVVGGTVSGLLPGTSVVLQNIRTDDTTVTSDGPFAFPTRIATGAPYSVTVSVQPFGQTCVTSHAGGVASAGDTIDVSVTCSANAYAIGVTVAGLTGAGLVVQNNGGDPLAIDANGSFQFATLVESGSPYDVTVLAQPAGQQCAVVSGAGTVGDAAVDVAVNCVQLPDSWNWVGGSNLVNSPGVYGTLNVGAPGNIPGARYGSVSWTDSSGNFWLFGGIGFDAAGATGPLNDLWEYSAGQWIWKGGSDSINASGTYGTQGVAAAGNIPGARFAAVLSIDAAGSVWLSGGQGLDSAGTTGLLNDLWVYANDAWTWVSGADTVNATGTYGTQGTAAPGNVPGARFAHIAWIDSSGDFWLFGGLGFDSTGAQGFQNDLWKYSAGQWTWVGGSNTVQASGIYGTEGVAAPTNVPGARLRPVSWFDSAGDLWLFGGLGFDVNGSQGGLNDLWRYSAGQWTWMGGSDTINAAGTYGTKGVAAAGNVPGARFAAIAWIDSSGNFWLSGGQALDGVGNAAFLNDLWKYSAGQWTWVSGSDTPDVSGSYGTQGTASVDNVPGSRYAAVSWIDASDHLWMFGGIGFDSAGANGGLNDLWEYAP